MPNLGMVEYLEEHLPQKIWPHARQWCCDTGQVRAAWLATLHAHPPPSTAHCRTCQTGSPRPGWAEGKPRRPQRPWGNRVHLQALNCSLHFEEKMSNYEEKFTKNMHELSR